jgi:hypothetical protein
MKAFRVWLFLGLISACSSSNPGDDAGGGDAGNDVTTQKDATSDVTQGNDTGTDAKGDGSSDAQVGDASDGGSGNFTLTINDYLNWCNVSVNGGQATSTPQPMQFPPDASVALHGDTASSASFYWGYWQAPGVGDGGKVTNMDVNVTMNGDVTILACCPVNTTPLSCP